ncbi:unnamed protein product [Lampetra planeri]
MVEGPGCTLNGERIRVRVRVSQTVLSTRTAASGVAVQHHQHHQQQQQRLSSLTGQQYTGVETLGKELFLYFKESALRVHFGMNGSMRINPGADGQTQRPPALEVVLSSDRIVFYDSTFDVRSAEACRERVRARGDLDVCSSRFDVERACTELGAHAGRMLCDVLLDQALLPGVGNIIKNEGLLDSGLHPAITVSQLSLEQIKHLVKMTRDFSLLFYQCRKTGAALQKHCRVYKRSACGQCRTRVVVCRLGENGRMTYFCPRCQHEDPRHVDPSKLQHRNNSLLAWVQGGRPDTTEVGRQDVASRAEEEWACAACTLINRGCDTACDACLTQRPPPEPQADCTEHCSTLHDDRLMLYPCNAFPRPCVVTKVNRRTAFGTATLIITSPGLPPGPPARDAPFGAGGSSDSGQRMHCSARPSKKTSLNVSLWDHTGRFSAGVKSPKKRRYSTERDMMLIGLYPEAHEIPDASGAAACDGTVARCRGHDRPCALRVVQKAGPNRGRHFHACALPQKQQCQHFEWADLHFPECDHGLRCVMRTVLKLGPNNGRNFYACAQGRDRQCAFFQWADGAPGVHTLPGC